MCAGYLIASYSSSAEDLLVAATRVLLLTILGLLFAGKSLLGNSWLTVSPLSDQATYWRSILQ